MDIGKSIQFVFDDERWFVKLLIGAVIFLLSMIIVIPIFFLIGYAVKVTRNVKDGVKTPLPEWDDWGKLFMDGIYIFIAQFVYTLPILIIVCIAMVATGGMGAIAESGGNPDALMAMMSSTLLLMSCLIFIYAIAMIFISPAVIIQYILNNDEFGACFRFGEVFGIARDSIGDILLVVVVTIGISFVVSLVGWIPCIGWAIALLSYPYMMAVSGHLYGQIAVKHFGGGGKEEQFAV